MNCEQIVRLNDMLIKEGLNGVKSPKMLNDNWDLRIMRIITIVTLFSARELHVYKLKQK